MHQLSAQVIQLRAILFFNPLRTFSSMLVMDDMEAEREKDESEEFDRSGVAEFPFDDAEAALVD
jgi:hypothetical protein